MLRSAVPREGSGPAGPAAGSARLVERYRIFRQETHPDDGSIIIGSTNSQTAALRSRERLRFDVSLTSKFPITVTADLPAGGKFKLDGAVGPVDQANTTLTPPMSGST